MTIIRAHCPTCGGVDLTPDEVRLTLTADAMFDAYTFTCPVCVRHVTKPADLFAAALLTSAGVLTIRLEIPAEAREAHTGPVLTVDDLLDFILADIDTCELVA